MGFIGNYGSQIGSISENFQDLHDCMGFIGNYGSQITASVYQDLSSGKLCDVLTIRDGVVCKNIT